MIRHRLLLRSFAIFFIVEMVISIAVPTFSWALTEGPSAPEASSFEPVDASEMVNLNTGDMVYNLPLLEVPGPGGSYPVSIAYHAGINPAQDASWVGLGWNINPGSIMRAASGYPDDWKNVNSQNSESWEGGTTHRVSKGISLSYWGITLSAGQIKTNDTYKGSQRGGYTSFGFGKSGAFVGFSASDDPSGSSVSISGGYGYGFGGKEGKSSAVGSISLGVNSVFTAGGSSSSGNLSGGIAASFPGKSEANPVSILGASISSDGSYSATVAGVGFNGGHLNNSGKVKTETNSNLSQGQQAAIHFGTGSLFDYSDDYIKYSTNEIQNSFVNGALYTTPGGSTLSYFDTRDFDIYDMVEVPSGTENSTDINDPKFGVGNEIMMGGTLPATDNYMVMGQGTGGNIKPYDLMGTLYRQNKKNKDDKYITKQYTDELGTMPQNNGRSEFMFINEFSNSYLYDNSGAGEYFGTGSTPLQFDFNAQKVSADSAFSGDKASNNKLARASNIEWYSNKDIVDHNNITGLILPNAKGFERDTMVNYDDQVGAIKITNPSGVTYHYALPAYTFDEVHYTENTAYDLNKTGAFKTIVKRQKKYAYTWYLTAVTGPDYVDRGEPGLSEDDWGYWIGFEYGKWTAAYKWRTPETGFVEDFDGDFRDYSSGTKELYYLNAIRSATHTALFIKDLRRDGKGLSSNDRESSFEPSACGSYPVSTLKLTEIVLIENSHLPNINYSNNHSQIIFCTKPRNAYPGDTGQTEYDLGIQLAQNVLLSGSITADQQKALKDFSIKRVSLETDDTQMMPNTSNSFSNQGLYNSTNPVLSPERFGKLELKSIQVYGRGAESLIPPIKFDYKNKTTSYDKDKTDYWGFYKSDYDASIKDTNIRKETSDQSALEVDTWSLNKIVTSLGAIIQIDYESDDYEKSVLHNKVNFKVSSMTTEGDGSYKIFINELNGKLDKYFNEGDSVNSLLVISQAQRQTIEFDKTIQNPSWFSGIPGPPRITIGSCEPVDYFKLQNVQPYFNRAKIRDITHDYLLIDVSETEKISYKVPYISTPDHNNIPITSAVLPFYALASSSNPDQNAVQYCEPREETILHYNDFIGGEIYAEINENKKGGGLRVKEISIIEPVSDITNVTSYDYKNPNTGKSSGVTTYVPVKTNEFTLDYPDHYEKAIEGYFIDGNLRDGGFLADIIKNWQEITRTLLLGPSTEHFLDYFDIIDHPDRKSMAAFLGVGLATANEGADHMRTQLMGELLSKVNEVPSAEVMYEYVTVKNSVIHGGTTNENPSYVVNQFIVYDPSMVNITASRQKNTVNWTADDSTPDITNNIRKLMKREVTINNFGNAVGQLKASRIYATSNGSLLSEKIYHYLHELNNTSDDLLNNYSTKLNDYQSQGALDETYVNARQIPYDHDYRDEEQSGIGDDPVEEKEVFLHDLVGVVTKRRNLPMILLSVENKNYKTGITSVDKTLAFDLYSGSVTKSSSTDGYGNTYLSETVPAYRKHQGMGLAIAGGRNMLTQIAANYTYKVSASNYAKNSLVSAAATIWSDQIPSVSPGAGYQNTFTQNGIWKTKSTYSWKGDDVTLNADGFYPINNFSVFNFGTNATNSDQWQKNSEITLTDVYSHALEASDLNGDYAATRMSSNNARVFATAANAKYNEFAYSGMEDSPVSNLYGGGVSLISGVENTTFVHTGKKSLSIGAGVKGCEVALKTSSKKKNYHANVWVYDNGSAANARLTYQFDSNTPINVDIDITKAKKSGAWYQFNIDFPVPSTTNNLTVGFYNKGGSGTIIIDDVRVHPFDAAMTSYVYNEWGELSHLLDGNNMFTRYEYDSLGRLTSTFRETFDKGVVKLSEQAYHYSND
jgi:YD repeat-containing protein